MVFVGPVLKKRQKLVAKIKNQAAGNGVIGNNRNKGNARTIAAPETRKYDPPRRGLSQSPTAPPVNVPASPETTTIGPKKALALSRPIVPWLCHTM